MRVGARDVLVALGRLATALNFVSLLLPTNSATGPNHLQLTSTRVYYTAPKRRIAHVTVAYRAAAFGMVGRLRMVSDRWAGAVWVYVVVPYGIRHVRLYPCLIGGAVAMAICDMQA